MLNGNGLNNSGIDLQSLINLGGGAFLCILGWIGKTLWDAVHSLKNDIHDLEIELPSNYVRREEFTESFREIREMLGKIFDKLDGKADK